MADDAGYYRIKSLPPNGKINLHLFGIIYPKILNG
jgi:hypothetical protein